MTLEESLWRRRLGKKTLRCCILAVGRLGKASIRVTKSQVAFRRRKNFAVVWMPSKYLKPPVAPLVISLSLSRKDRSRRWKQVTQVTPHRFTHPSGTTIKLKMSMLKSLVGSVRHGKQPPNPSLHPTCYGWLRQPLARRVILNVRPPAMTLSRSKEPSLINTKVAQRAPHANGFHAEPARPVARRTCQSLWVSRHPANGLERAAPARRRTSEASDGLPEAKAGGLTRNRS